MRSLLISGLVVLTAAVIQAEVFKKEKVTLGKKSCLCDFNIKIGDKCSGSAKCDKKCSGSGTVELGGCSFDLAVKKGKGKISKCSCEAATVPVPTEPTTGSGSGETPVPMTGSGSGETPVPIPTSPGSGSGGPPPAAGGEGMQCSCKCNCPDGSGECDCDCNCPMTSTALTCAPGFSKVCPMMGDMCPEDMDPICPYNAMNRMAGNANGQMDKGCQCVPDFLLAMVMIQPAARMDAVDRAMTKATIQIGKKKCKCSYEMNAEDCKKSKIACDKKCSGKATDVEIADGDVIYMVDVAIKKGKVTIAKCDVDAPVTTGAGGGSTGSGSGSGNGEGGMGGMGSKCACVSRGMGGSGPTAPPLPPTGSGSEPAPPTGSGSGSGSAGSRSYLAGLSYSFDSSNSPFCAGSLISSQWVLTTASCSYSDTIKTAVDKVRVVLGEETLGTTDQENFKVVSVSKIIVHPSYSQSSSTGQNNLALWKLSEPVSTSVYSTVCLPAQGEEQAGGATLVGWRISPLLGSLSQTLTQVETQLVSATQCGVSDTILCTSADTTGCQGDLGGPLLQGDNLLIGAVASDKGCARAGYGIFTQVSKFTSWVETQVTSNGGGAVCVK